MSSLISAERKEFQKVNGNVALETLRGAFSYASAREMAARVGVESAGHKAVIYDLTEAAHMDTSAALALEELIEQANKEHEACFLSGLQGKARETLGSLGVLSRLPESRQFATRPEAIHAAVEFVLAK